MDIGTVGTGNDPSSIGDSPVRMDGSETRPLTRHLPSLLVTLPEYITPMPSMTACTDCNSHGEHSRPTASATPGNTGTLYKVPAPRLPLGTATRVRANHVAHHSVTETTNFPFVDVGSQVWSVYFPCSRIQLAIAPGAVDRLST